MIKIEVMQFYTIRGKCWTIYNQCPSDFVTTDIIATPVFMNKNILFQVRSVLFKIKSRRKIQVSLHKVQQNILKASEKLNGFY